MTIIINNYVIIPDSPSGSGIIRGVTLYRELNRVAIHADGREDFRIDFGKYQEAKKFHKCLADILSKYETVI